jgi:uncharacterized protein (UPF0210 family)
VLAECWEAELGLDVVAAEASATPTDQIARATSTTAAGHAIRGAVKVHLVIEARP